MAHQQLGRLQTKKVCEPAEVVYGQLHPATKTVRHSLL